MAFVFTPEDFEGKRNKKEYSELMAHVLSELEKRHGTPFKSVKFNNRQPGYLECLWLYPESLRATVETMHAQVGYEIRIVRDGLEPVLSLSLKVERFDSQGKADLPTISDHSWLALGRVLHQPQALQMVDAWTQEGCTIDLGHGAQGHDAAALNAHVSAEHPATESLWASIARRYTGTEVLAWGADASKKVAEGLLTFAPLMDRVLAEVSHFPASKARDAAPAAPHDQAEEPWVEELRRRKQVILYGPPGTGKTWHALRLLQPGKARPVSITREGAPPVVQTEMVTFHQSYSYEDFVEGIRPNLLGADSGELGYALHEGAFLRICRRALLNPELDFYLVIDEINRGNISRILGELITLLEKDKRVCRAAPSAKNAEPVPASWVAFAKGADPKRWFRTDTSVCVTLPYSGREFVVPDNLYVVGTMNTADRSIAFLDVALRRRFAFYELEPNPSELRRALEDSPGAERFATSAEKVLAALNTRLEHYIDRDHRLGHALFMDLADAEDEQEFRDRFAKVLRYDIVPLLCEYFRNDWRRLQLVLGSWLVEGDPEAVDDEMGQPTFRLHELGSNAFDKLCQALKVEVPA